MHKNLCQNGYVWVTMVIGHALFLLLAAVWATFRLTAVRGCGSGLGFWTKCPNYSINTPNQTKHPVFLTMKVLENTPAVLSLGKLCDENGYSYEWINGHKPHLIKDGIRIICNTENFVPIVVPGLSSSSSASSSTLRTPMKQESRSSSSSSSSPSSPTVGEMSVREREDASNSDISPVPVSELVDDRSGKPEETQANKTSKPNKKKTTIERGNLCDDSEIPEWLQEFRENLVDDEIPLQGGSHASSSHEVSLEPTIKRREDLGKHNVHTHFPKDRNCEICKRTKITRAPCRRRNGGAVPRAESFGDLITADHKVLSENLSISSWSCDMEGHAKKCVERYCELANKTTQHLHKVSTPCIDDHHFKEEEMKSVGELSQVCSQIVPKS